MTHPVAHQTPAGPAYEGRLLPQPDEEVVDQGLQFDIGTLLTRRRILGLLGVGVGTVGLAACGAPRSTGAAATAAGSLAEIPDETNGPYPADGSNGPDVLEQSGIVRSDITGSFGDADGVAAGVPFTLTLTVVDLAEGGVPFEGAAGYVWHCDRDGAYSMYSQGIESENYLRGVQVADADGRVTFTSIFPACYSGRWPHVHFEVYPDLDSITDHDACVCTSQVALPEDVCDDVYANAEGYQASTATFAQITLDSDMVFADGVETQLATVTGDRERGYTATLTVGVDTTTEQTGGAAPGGPGGQPPGGQGGPAGTGGPPGPPPSDG